jgi:hypothetical protein
MSKTEKTVQLIQPLYDEKGEEMDRNFGEVLQNTLLTPLENASHDDKMNAMDLLLRVRDKVRAGESITLIESDVKLAKKFIARQHQLLMYQMEKILDGESNPFAPEKKEK